MTAAEATGAPRVTATAGALSAERAIAALPGPREPAGRLRSVIEQALVFSGATLAAVYTPDTTGSALALVESAGVPRSLYGLRDTYPADGDSPMAAARRERAPLWLTPDALDGCPPPDQSRAKDISVAALPLGDAAGHAGCLLAVTERPGGFGTGEQDILVLLAAALGGTVPAPARDTCPGDHDDAGSFGLAMDSGRIDADARLLALFGMAPGDFDGRVETLLAQTVPEDLPTLMSVVEADHMAIGDRELDFRIQRPSGEPRWLRLRGQVVADADGRTRLLGTVTDTSDLRSGVTDVTRVQRLAAVLAGTSTVREASQAVAAGLRAPLNADRIALAELEGERLVVTVLDPPDPELWPGTWRTEWRSEWPDAPLRAMPTLSAAIRDGRPAILEAGTPLEPDVAEVGPGGLAVLPLPAGGRTAGLCLIGWDEPHAFGADERAFLTAAAGLAGQALTRVRASDAEHELVGTLQRSLLPRRLPDIPGGRAVARYLPTVAGLEVGGDWYDVIPLPDQHVALVIGDVQGHNAVAASLMGQMRTALRAYAIEGHSPDVVISHTNRLLVGMETDLFATCCYLDVDMESGSVLCVRAGHLPPVLRLPDGRVDTVDTAGGPPLGVVPDADFPMTELVLEPGTLVALTTDGLVESAGCDIDVGIAALGDALARSDPGHLGLVADALLDGANRNDDVALLLMRYDGTAVRPRRAGLTVRREPHAVRAARDFTGRTLDDWRPGTGTEGTGTDGGDTGGAGTADTVLLVVTELVTNALLHTTGPVRLDLTLVRDRLRVAVGDASPRSPVKPVATPWEATGGRGLLMVEAVTAAWGTVPVSGGKQVWAEIVTGPARP
ncbi:SpoIIE family protein phosphatase [Streptomyces uncialis]|uniref:SpoIIE family protein phosphatase n=1 Tax=Streptomyces uncialis TaxID=1048205 RepID=UPI00386776AC|nr:SpoIIE family protein phosphatase [Streptomyces uncialis]